MEKSFKSKIIIVGIIFFVVVVCLAFAFSDKMPSNSLPSKIEVIEEKFITDYRGYNNLNNNYFCPIVDVEIKNVANHKISVWYDVNFYCEDQLICSAQSEMITLEIGDTYNLWGQGNKGVRWGMNKNWSYKITNWHIVNG